MCRLSSFRVSCRAQINNLHLTLFCDWIRMCVFVIDVNECDETKDICEPNSLRCDNTAGSYLCTCKTGYKNKDATNKCTGQHYYRLCKTYWTRLSCCSLISSVCLFPMTYVLSHLSRVHLFILFFSCPTSEGWPHHGRTFSIYLCPLSFWLTLPRKFLSTSWCYASRPCVIFLACVHLALFLVLSFSPGNSLVSSWCDHSMLVSLLGQWLTPLLTPALLRTHLLVCCAVHKTCRIFLDPFISKASRRLSLFFLRHWHF